MAEGEKTVVSNRKAFHDYSIEDRYEAGIVLRGSEVKALREAKANIREAFATVRNGEMWLVGMHISPYSAVSTHEAVSPERERKLLLSRKEIDRIAVKVGQRGYTLVPLRVYFKHGLAKIELGLGRGKHTYDRRRDLAERDAKRDIEREVRRRDR